MEQVVKDISGKDNEEDNSIAQVRNNESMKQYRQVMKENKEWRGKETQR